MATMTSEIRSATAADHDGVVDVIVMAFTADPTARWLYPDSRDYLRHCPDFMRAFGGRAFEHGTAHFIEGMCGAALWLPPGVGPDEEAVTRVLKRTVDDGRHDEVFALFEQMDHYHPTEPHWYLPLIGVDPAHHRKGLGSALMKHALRLCDGDGLPAYLESSNPENIPLYERHGFEPLGTIQVGSSPPLCPMLRQPR